MDCNDFSEHGLDHWSEPILVVLVTALPNGLCLSWIPAAATLHLWQLGEALTGRGACHTAFTAPTSAPTAVSTTSIQHRTAMGSQISTIGALAEM